MNTKQIAQRLANSETAVSMKNKAKELAKNPSVQKNLLYAGLGIGAIYFGRKAYLNYKKSQTEKRIDEDTVQQATAIHLALNPSGISFMSSMDGTNTDYFFKVMEKVKDFNQVAKDYKNLYNESLVEQVEKELNQNDYKRFLYMISTISPEDKKKNLKFILMPNGGKIYSSLTLYPFGSIKEAPANSYLNNPTDLKTKSYTFFGSFIHSQQLNETNKKLYDVWIKMDDVIIATVDEIKAKYMTHYKNKVVFKDEDFK